MGTSRIRIGAFLSILLALLAALALAPFATQQALAAEGDLTTSSLHTQSIIDRGKAGTCAWVLDSSGTLTMYAGNYEPPAQQQPFTTGDHDADVKKVVFEGEGAQKVVAGDGVYRLMLNFPNMTSVDLSGLDTSKVTDFNDMFDGCTSLTSIDLSPLDTSEAVSMLRMFADCSSLKSLDLSGLKTSKVNSMDGMFSGCSSLSSINLSGIATSKVETMSNMFSGCSSLKSLDLSGLNTSNVENMEFMFEGCSLLETLDLSAFDTSEVETMKGVFSDCSSLKKLNISGFNTSEVEDMSWMFSGCLSLKKLDLSTFDTSEVEDMNRMFNGCSSLTSLKLSGFDTSEVTDMRSMFADCSKLSLINVSGFNTRKVTKLNRMFKNCSAVKALDLSGFKVSKVKESAVSLFDGCLSLSWVKLPKGLGISRMPGSWKGPDGTVLRDSDFATKYDSATMYGKWVKLRKLSDYTVAFVKADFGKRNHVFKGSAYKPAVTVTGGDGAVITKGIDYKVTYKYNKNVGTAQVIVQGIGGMSGKKVLTFKIVKAAQTISAKSCKATFTGKKLGGVKALASDKIVWLAKRAKVSAKTAVRCVKANKVGGKKIVVAYKTGKVTLKKGLKAGTYKVKVRLTAVASKNYKKAPAKIITLKVVVK